MSEIDVNKCDYSDIGECFDNDFEVMEYIFCNLFDEPCTDVRKRNRCFYQLKHKLQHLKAENDNLKQEVNRHLKQQEVKDNYLIPKLKKYKQCLGEIEKLQKELCRRCDLTFCPNTICYEILQKIKEVKGDE